MPDFKDKKTLDEILSDLNKILDRMPDLTEKLKAPEIKPINFSSIVEDKIGDKLENSAERDDTKSFTEKEKSVIESQSATDREEVYTTDYQQIPDVDSPAQEPVLHDVVDVSDPVQKDGKLVDKVQNEAVDTNADIKDQEDKILGNTADFGVPDIDFLINLEQSYSSQDRECEKDSVDFQKRQEDEYLDGGEMDDKNQGKENYKDGEENLNLNEKSAELDSEITLNLNDESERISSSDDLPSNQEKSDSQSEISLQIDIEKLDSIESQTAFENPNNIGDQNLSEDTIGVEPSDMNFQQPQKDKSSGQVLDLNLEVPSQVEQKKQQPQVYEKPYSAHEGLEQFTLAVNDNNPSKGDSLPEEDKTLVFEPSIPEQQGQDLGLQEEKTAVFSPDETNSILQSDRDFSTDQAPSQIPSERIKNAGFIFSDRNMLNHVLKTLDEICLASKDKPMFINRSFIFEYSQDFSSNLINQKAAETSCQAIVAAGEMPHENVYELETVFSSAGIIFRHFKPSDFSKSQAIDFILDLIAK